MPPLLFMQPNRPNQPHTHKAAISQRLRKLSVSFFRYLGDRLHVPGAISIPPLPDLVRQAASAV